MASIIRMPEVLAGASEAVLSNWLVAEGQTVAVGDVLAEIETEKATVEYQAEEAGVLAKTLIGPGDTAEVGTPIAIFLGPGEGAGDVEKALADAGEPLGNAPVGDSAPTHTSAHNASDSARDHASDNGVDAGRLFASPLVRKLARENGVDIGTIAGSGPSGRITRRDFEAFVAATPGPDASKAPHAPVTPTPASLPAAATVHSAAEFVDVAHTGMRKAIARRLTESKSTVPHFYLTADCVVDKLLAARAEMNEATGLRISVNDWVMKAVAHALVSVPEANAVWMDTAVRRFTHADISVAVATDGGLLTPVIRGVDQMSLSEINTAIQGAAERARSGSIRQEEIEGGSFAVTNLGMYGVKEFQAIVNPPQSGILAVGAAQPRPVVSNGELAVGTVMTVSLSADHRAVDGALAAQWLSVFQTAIENPMGMLA